MWLRKLPPIFIILVFYFTVIAIALLIGGCAKGKSLSSSQVSEIIETEKPVLIKVSSLPFDIKIGDSLNIPELDIKMVKISHTHYLAAKKETIIKNTTREVEFVQTKITNIDKSKIIDRSKDKSQTDSGNKEKITVKNKTKETPWWIFLLIAIAIMLFYAYKKLNRYPYL